MRINLSKYNGRDVVDSLYNFLSHEIKRFIFLLMPHLRMFIRFLALPYAFFFLIDWEVCKKSKLKVAGDFIYLFFIYKNFPDHYQQCRLWEKTRSEWAYYWGSNYNPYQRRSLQYEMQEPKYSVIYGDKNLCQDMCSLNKIPMPRLLGIVKKGEAIEDSVMALSKLHKDIKRFIAKPKGGSAGHAIHFFEAPDDDNIRKIYSSGSFNSKAAEDYIVQEAISQHSELNRVAKSVNTVRFVTMICKSGKIVTVGAYIRFGSGDSLVDNLSKGGYAVKIDYETGNLVGQGYDIKGRPRSFHPVTEIKFNSVKVPYWEDVVSLAHSIQKKLYYHRIIGMDIAVTPSGPMVIELNSIYDNIGLEGICGPIFKRREIFEAFQEYSLLFSNAQKKVLQKHYRLTDSDGFL